MILKKLGIKKSNSFIILPYISPLYSKFVNAGMKLYRKKSGLLVINRKLISRVKGRVRNLEAVYEKKVEIV